MISAIANKITAFILVIILFAHNINTLVIIGDFMINQAVIAKNFCVQKNNQQGCNGKCQLVKELKKSTPESNANLPVQETRRMSLDAFCLYNIITLEHNTIIYQDTCINFNASSKNLISTYIDVDTPPPIVS